MTVDEQGAGWRRLHPLSPLVRFGRLVVGAIVVLVPGLEGGFQGPHHRGSGAWVAFVIWAALVGLAAIGGAINWAVTRWRVDGTDLQIETGVVRRQSLRIPLSRVQAVDIVAPLLARMFGVAEVRVVSAGRGGERGRLAYVTAAEAPQIRARLLALAHGLGEDTPEPASVPLATVSNGRLVAALPLRGAILVHLLLLAAIVGVIVAVPPRLGVPLLSVAITELITAAAVVGRVLNEELEFTIAEAPDGFRLDRGLLQRRHETIPLGRIQAVRVVQPLLWRPFGWQRLEVDVARQIGVQQRRQEPAQFSRTLLPVGAEAEIVQLLQRVFPGAGTVPPPTAQPPRRAVLRAPFAYHFLAGWIGNSYVYARTGRLQAATVVVPLAKVQSVRRAQGPLQRALRLASLHVDTAGRRWSASLVERDDAETERLLWEVAGRAQQARRTGQRSGVAVARTAMA